MRILIIIFTLFQLVACNQKTQKDSKSFDRSINEPTRSMSLLKGLVLRKGDKDAYYELQMAYLDLTYPEEFLLYAMTMANKYDFPEAYFDVYNCIVSINRLDIKSIDQKSASLAVEYLLIASKKNHEQAQEIVNKYSVNNEVADKRALIIQINK
ncbi:MAG: hypothetical protein EAZ57_04165 [Cytophagales bacterium]|nr:MAG: hypothetical protein EAZ67_05185 [Cytophagales bacterium]TAF61194.1 MAG: hypothetical protein EAZ57_04165 [Cytophagales bacterium]